MAMRTGGRHMFRTALCLVAALLLAGCYEVHQGRYLAGKVPGWSRRDDLGSCFFEYPTKHVPNWHIQMGGDKRGSFRVGIGSFARDPYKIWKQNLLTFSGTPIRIIFHDPHREVTIAADGFQSLYGQTLDVDGSQDFTVIVPSFRVGDNVVPELSAHVRWSDDKYRIWVPLQ